MQDTKTICGDCGDDLVINPDRGPGRTVTVEISPGSRITQQVTVYDNPSYLHEDDRTPQCTNRDQAAVRRARKVAELD